MDGFNKSLFSDIHICCPTSVYKPMIFRARCPLQEDQIVLVVFSHGI